jgi:hypothetical protein
VAVVVAALEDAEQPQQIAVAVAVAREVARLFVKLIPAF